MNISNLLKNNFITVELKASDKLGVLEELSEIFASNNDDVDAETMVRVLLEREKLGSTGIGDGIAIPHGKIGGIENIYIGFGRSKKGVEFDALDGKPVHLLFVLVAPESASGKHLKALAKISRMLMDQRFRSDLMSAATVDDLYKTITEMDHRIT
jgi:PTS system nitrogen regulatory IIA component